MAKAKKTKNDSPSIVESKDRVDIFMKDKKIPPGLKTVGKMVEITIRGRVKAASDDDYRDGYNCSIEPVRISMED